jgi:hypothetical protein
LSALQAPAISHRTCDTVNLCVVLKTSTSIPFMGLRVGNGRTPKQEGSLLYEALDRKEIYMNALQTYKQKGRLLAKHMANVLNTPVTLSQAYEALACMEGAVTWNELAARAVKEDAAKSSLVPVPAGVPDVPQTGGGLVLDVKLGAPQNASLLQRICVQLVKDAELRHASADHEPIVQADVEEVLSEYNVVSTVEVGFAEEALLAVRKGLRELNCRQAASFLSVVEVNMLDIVGDYDVPEQVPEWAWIESNSSFAHKGNGTEPGVYEFMVHIKAADQAPERLQPLFELAKEQNAAWVMFHQG